MKAARQNATDDLETLRGKVRAKLLTFPRLSVGVGTRDAPCSVAAINLAINGRLTDTAPACASSSLVRWVAHVQDVIPAEIRDSAEWRNVLPSIVGTKDGGDVERIWMMIEWTWECLGDSAVVAKIPRSARAAWKKMVAEKTITAANAASDAAMDDPDALIDRVRIFTSACARDAGLASCFAEFVLDTGTADEVYAGIAADAIDIALMLGPAAQMNFWRRHDPAKMLRRLCEVAR